MTVSIPADLLTRLMAAIETPGDLDESAVAELLEDAEIARQAAQGWKVVEAVVLVREGDEYAMRDDVAKMIEFSDLSATGYVLTREPTADELVTFADVIEDEQHDYIPEDTELGARCAVCGETFSAHAEGVQA